jgi:hypothetical protein
MRVGEMDRENWAVEGRARLEGKQTHAKKILFGVLFQELVVEQLLAVLVG